MTPEETLARRVMDVANAAPQEWRTFMEAFSAYADAKAKECVQAPMEQLQVNQGRAQQVAKLVTLFSGAAKITSRIIQAAQKANVKEY